MKERRTRNKTMSRKKVCLRSKKRRVRIRAETTLKIMVLKKENKGLDSSKSLRKSRNLCFRGRSWRSHTLLSNEKTSFSQKILMISGSSTRCSLNKFWAFIVI